jgi:signal transduction histidine kinase
MQQRIDALIDQSAAHLSEATRAEYRSALDDADLEYLTEEVPSAIEQAIDGVHRVAEIVRALKDFSHPGGDSKSPLDLNQLVANTIAVCRNEWKYVAELETDFAADLPPVPALSGPMGQALLILIVNAAQAIADTRDDEGGLGRITVSTSADHETATIAVADTGGGIPDEIEDKIFEHFFTTKEVGKGSGQGLAIARSIVVEQHGGDIDFTSTIGEGTTFRIRLPLELPEAKSEAAA